MSTFAASMPSTLAMPPRSMPGPARRPRQWRAPSPELHGAVHRLMVACAMKAHAVLGLDGALGALHRGVGVAVSRFTSAWSGASRALRELVDQRAARQAAAAPWSRRSLRARASHARACRRSPPPRPGRCLEPRPPPTGASATLRTPGIARAAVSSKRATQPPSVGHIASVA